MRHPGRVLVVVALVPTVVFLVWLAAWLHDPRMGAREAERALSARVGGEDRYTCTRAEKDGSLSLDDVDYICTTPRGWPLYAVGTDGEGITELELFGGP